MRADPEVSLLQFLMGGLEAVLEPGAFDFDLEIAEAQLEQLLVGQGGPGKFPCRHEISNPESDLDPYNGVMRRMQCKPPHASREMTGAGESKGGARNELNNRSA